jgi:hypothetical protein
MTMTLDGKTYDQWLANLKMKAKERGLDLELQRFHYRSWFSHGYTPEAVVDDMLETIAGSDS